MEHTKGKKVFTTAIEVINPEHLRRYDHREVEKILAERDELLDFAQHFFTWHANNFGDFDEDTNGYLLNLANEAEQAIANATEDKIIDDADLCGRLAKGDPPEV